MKGYGISFLAFVMVTSAMFSSTREACSVPVYGEWAYNTGTNYWYTWTAPGTWEQARVMAQSWGGELVSIHSEEENAWVYETFTKYSPHPEGSHPYVIGCWIGLTDFSDEGNWSYWTDGTSVDYTNWSPSGQPDNNWGGLDEDFGHMIGDLPGEPEWSGKWNDLRQDIGDLPGIVKASQPIPEPATMVIVIGAGLALGSSIIRKRNR